MNVVLDKINWLMRRRYLYAVTCFVMLIMLLACSGLVEVSIATAIVTNGFWTLATFTGTYVFGAVWDHANQRKFGATTEPAQTEKSSDATVPT